MTTIELSKKELAGALGVATRSIEIYQTDPDFPRPRRQGRKNLYPLHECVAWFVDYRITQRIGESDGGEQLDLQQERARLARAQRQRQELLHKVDLGRYASIEAVAAAVDDEYARVRARLLAMPTKLAPELAVEDRIEACAEIVRVEVCSALSELSETGVDEIPR